MTKIRCTICHRPTDSRICVLCAVTAARYMIARQEAGIRTTLRYAVLRLARAHREIRRYHTMAPAA